MYFSAVKVEYKNITYFNVMHTVIVCRLQVKHE